MTTSLEDTTNAVARFLRDRGYPTQRHYHSVTPALTIWHHNKARHFVYLQINDELDLSPSTDLTIHYTISLSKPNALEEMLAFLDESFGVKIKRRPIN